MLHDFTSAGNAREMRFGAPTEWGCRRSLSILRKAMSVGAGFSLRRGSRRWKPAPAVRSARPNRQDWASRDLRTNDEGEFVGFGGARQTRLRSAVQTDGLP